MVSGPGRAGDDRRGYVLQLTAGYLFPISIRGFLPGRNADGSLRFFEKCEPTHVMLIPLVILTTLSLLAGMFPAQLTAFLTNLASTLM